MASKKFQAIFFDVGNTLLIPHPSVEEVCQHVLRQHHIESELADIRQALQVADREYERQYRRNDSFWLKEREAARFWTYLYELTLREIGVDGQAKELANQIYNRFGLGQHWRPFPDVVPVLDKLVDHYYLGIISNWDFRLPSLIIEMGLDRYFSFVLSSARIGMLKPQAGIFNLALKRARVPAEKAIHIGDHYYADVMGARSVGITPVLIDRHNQVENVDCLLVKNLYELVDCLQL